MHTYTHNPYEIPTPTTPRDEASSSNQQLVNTQKTPDRPENMRRVITKTRVNLNEKLLSAAQEAAFAASQEVLRKQDIKRKSDLLLVQIEEEEKRALIKFEAMQQAVQIEKQAQESACAAEKASALALMMQVHIKNNAIIRKQALQELQKHHQKTAVINLNTKKSKKAVKFSQDYTKNVSSSSRIDSNLAPTPQRSIFLSAKYLQQPKSIFLSAKYLQQPCIDSESQNPCLMNDKSIRLSAEHLEPPCLAGGSYNYYWNAAFLKNNRKISNDMLEILQKDYHQTSSTSLKS